MIKLLQQPPHRHRRRHRRRHLGHQREYNDSWKQLTYPSHQVRMLPSHH